MSGRVEFTPPIVAAVLDLRLRGMSWEIVSEKVGIDTGVLLRFKKRHPDSDWAHRLRPKPFYGTALMADALNPPPGMSLADVGRKHGVTKNVVCGIRARAKRKGRAETP